MMDKASKGQGAWSSFISIRKTRIYSFLREGCCGVQKEQFIIAKVFHPVTEQRNRWTCAEQHYRGGLGLLKYSLYLGAI